MTIVDKVLDWWESWNYPQDKEMKARVEKMKLDNFDKLYFKKRSTDSIAPKKPPKLTA